MNLLPKASGSRPRLACEIFPGGVVAGRSAEPGLPVTGVAYGRLADGAILPGLRPGNVADRVAVIAAVRRALEQVGARSNGRNSELTLVIPDGAVRVLLLDFDALPSKLSEALPLVRFRLKKLLPFDADEAMVSFQVMSSSRNLLRVLAVAMPRDVLAEYETAVREAGFEPGAVLPSTLACLAGLQEPDGAHLLLNAHHHGVTAAIVRGGVLLLHRAVELTELDPPVPANLPPALFEAHRSEAGALLPLVDRDATEAEWAAQEPLPEFGRDPYADRLRAEQATQDEDAITALGVPPALFVDRDSAYSEQERVDLYAEAAPLSRSPYSSPALQQQLSTNFETAAYLTPPPGSVAESGDAVPRFGGVHASGAESTVHSLTPELRSEEIARAVSVAVAFYEDNLSAMPGVLLSTGSLGVRELRTLLGEQGLLDGMELRVEEMAGTAAPPGVPPGVVAGIVGALRS